ncbi:retrovirus-related Pol polyprotein from transposon 412 [Nephila pilipes]|uniref:Retrovirus-related Pol polyprotein from transposon 412 n=1 Tax=Nephila pilipes TaxID=299642 RepID=A0A8X6PTJ0_NEPPI|nr:retrovirus-related Pol polyprotein from transposon 412 [Nephila pilipes]
MDMMKSLLERLAEQMTEMKAGQEEIKTEMKAGKEELKKDIEICQGFFKIARPLHELTEAKQKFLRTDECEEAFRQLKVPLTSSPILAYLQPDKLSIFDTDASNESVGAVLS